MKKLLSGMLMAVALITAAAPSGAAVSASRSRSISMNATTGPNSIWLNVWQTTDLAGGPETVGACVTVSNGSAFDSGCGPVAVTIDHLALAGTIRGSIAGYYGPISVDLTYVRTRIGSNPPYLDAEVIPSPATANALVLLSANGRSSGTMTWAAGTSAITNGATHVIDFVTASINV